MHRSFSLSNYIDPNRGRLGRVEHKSRGPKDVPWQAVNRASIGPFDMSHRGCAKGSPARPQSAKRRSNKPVTRGDRNAAHSIPGKVESRALRRRIPAEKSYGMGALKSQSSIG